MMKPRIIDQLRARYPGTWAYDCQDYCWRHSDGRVVRRYAELSPKYDGDDDSFRSSIRFESGEEALTLLPFRCFS